MLSMHEFNEKYGEMFCTNHGGKMKDLYSLSTSVKCNPYCQKRIHGEKIKEITQNNYSEKLQGENERAELKLICAKCYADQMTNYCEGLREKLERNTKILSTVIIPVEDLPIIFSPSNMFRFESFGDLNNEIQVLNYFNIARYNPTVKCALWTKNPWIIEKAIKQYDITVPENLIIIGSSYFINQNMNDYYSKYPFIDYVFTVYDKKYIKENNININCGARSCANCKKCYYGSHESRFINEILK